MVRNTYMTMYRHMFDYTPILGGTRYHIKMYYHIIGSRVSGTYWYERLALALLAPELWGFIGWNGYHGNSGVTQKFAKHDPTNV